MSDLSLGGTPDFPPNWGFPSDPYNYCTGSYTACGMIWYGKDKCTLDDVLAIMDDPRSRKDIDRNTLCGTNDPAWTTQADLLKKQSCYKQMYRP